MATGKESPRQKMVGMMYLVLTALLALNVSKEIMNSFVIVNEALAKTNTTFKDRNELLYGSFERLKANDPVKAAPLFEKAMTAKKLSLKLDSHLRELKVHLIAETEGIPKSVADTIDLADVEAKDNYDTPTHILVGAEEDGSKGKANELKKMILKYKKDLMMLLPEKDRKDFRSGAEIQNMENTKGWEVETFYHAPLAASVTMLTKLQNDVKNAESEVIQRLYASVNKDDYKFDTLAAKVIAPSSYILLGDEFRADVFVAAFSTTQNPEILTGTYDASTDKFSGSTGTVPVSNGIGKVSVKAVKEGVNKITGVVKLKAPDGSFKPFPFESEYIVARPAAVVAPVNMNVLYADVDNPLAISVPGVASDKIKVSISNGQLTKGSNGQFIARVSNPGTAEVKVSAQMPDGSLAPMGTLQFRVKQVPSPVLTVGSVTGGGRIRKSELVSQLGPIAKFENFDFKLPLNVKSFKIGIAERGEIVYYDVYGNKFSDVVKNKFSQLRNGSKIFIEEVRVVDGVGKARKVPEMMLTVYL